MIKVKGRVVTFTGKDAKALVNLAASLNLTPQETVIQAIEYQMEQFKKAEKLPLSKQKKAK